MKDLTKKQKQLMEILNDFHDGKGYWPTYREISKLMNLKSSAGPYKHLKHLQEKGYIERPGNMSRVIKLRKPVDRKEPPYIDLIKSLYWTIELQRNWKSLSGTFDIISFEKYVEDSRINIDNDEHKENIESIERQYFAI